MSAWANFYVITGSSAAALTGLMFVVMTLLDSNPTRVRREGISAFSTPTVVHLAAAFLLSAIASAPWPSAVNAAVVLGAAGLTGMAYVSRVAYRVIAFRSAYRPDAEDWMWFAILPFAAYAAVSATAILLGVMASKILFALAAAVVLLIFIGIHNAWDIVTFITVVQQQSDGAEGERRDDSA